MPPAPLLPDGSGQLWMGTSDDSSGQRWRLVDHGGGKYALQTSYLGECFSLNVVNDGTNTTPCLAPTGGFSGQNWTLTPRPDGTCRLVNDLPVRTAPSAPTRGQMIPSSVPATTAVSIGR